MVSIKVSHAVATGRHHRLMRQNCQDMADSAQPRPGYAFGLVLDGCGGKWRPAATAPGRRPALPSHNEVGAKLLAAFAGRRLGHWLAAAVEPDLDTLYADCVTFLQQITGLVAPTAVERQQFVATHLLCTLLGFLMTPTGATFFWSGDGYLVHNGQVTTLAADNRPDYLAYRLLDGQHGRFQSQRLPDQATIEWLAVASDGWRADQLAALPPARSSLALQRWLNCQAQQRGHADDDAAIAALWADSH
jgi:hypothetical protein